MTQPLVALSSGPDTSSARQVADTLVIEGLAACVNLIPGRHPIYMYTGGQAGLGCGSVTAYQNHTKAASDTGRAPESPALLPPIDPLPKLIALPVLGGSTEYLAWLQQATQSEP